MTEVFLRLFKLQPDAGVVVYVKCMKTDEVLTLVNEFRVEAIQIQPNGNIPNSELPLLIYRRAVRLQSDDPASVFEKLFEANGWTGSWRDAAS